MIFTTDVKSRKIGKIIIPNTNINMAKVQTMNNLNGAMGRYCSEMKEDKILPHTSRYNQEIGPKLIGIGSAIGAVILLVSTFSGLFLKPIDNKERRYENRKRGY